jgi:hypothetical protein
MLSSLIACARRNCVNSVLALLNAIKSRGARRSLEASTSKVLADLAAENMLRFEFREDRGDTSSQEPVR